MEGNEYANRQRIRLNCMILQFSFFRFYQMFVSAIRFRSTDVRWSTNKHFHFNQWNFKLFFWKRNETKTRWFPLATVVLVCYKRSHFLCLIKLFDSNKQSPNLKTRENTCTMRYMRLYLSIMGHKSNSFLFTIFYFDESHFCVSVSVRLHNGWVTIQERKRIIITDDVSFFLTVRSSNNEIRTS